MPFTIQHEKDKKIVKMNCVKFEFCFKVEVNLALSKRQNGCFTFPLQKNCRIQNARIKRFKIHSSLQYIEILIS